MGNLAKKIEEWATSASWEDSEAIVLWARPFGDDVARAWRECPRADYLVILAEVGGVEDDVLHRAARAVTRRVARACREHARVLGGIQRVVDEHLRNERSLASYEVDDHVALRAECGKNLQVYGAFYEARERVCAFLRSAKSRLDRGDAVSTFASAPELVSLHTVMMDSAKRTAAMHAVRAHFQAVELGKTTERIHEWTAVLAAAEEDATRTDEAVELLLAIREGSGFVVGRMHLLLEKAALAEGHASTRTDAAWEECLRALLGAKLPEAADQAHHTIAAVVADTRDALAARRTAQLSAEYADVLRAEIPFDALDFTEDQEPEPPIRWTSVARSHIQDGLTATLAVARQMGHVDVVEPIEIALAILGAPGELDRAALSPVMATVHERLAIAFRAEAKAAGPREGKPWLGLARQVDEDRRFFTEWMSANVSRGN